MLPEGKGLINVVLIKFSAEFLLVRGFQSVACVDVPQPLFCEITACGILCIRVKNCGNIVSDLPSYYYAGIVFCTNCFMYCRVMRVA
jgi:hypothetical protein